MGPGGERDAVNFLNQANQGGTLAEPGDGLQTVSSSPPDGDWIPAASAALCRSLMDRTPYSITGTELTSSFHVQPFDNKPHRFFYGHP